LKNTEDLRAYLELYFEDNTMDDFLTDIEMHPADFVVKAYESGTVDDLDLLMLLDNDDDNVEVV